MHFCWKFSVLLNRLKQEKIKSYKLLLIEWSERLNLLFVPFCCHKSWIDLSARSFPCCRIKSGLNGRYERTIIAPIPRKVSALRICKTTFKALVSWTLVFNNNVKIAWIIAIASPSHFTVLSILSVDVRIPLNNP